MSSYSNIWPCSIFVRFCLFCNMASLESYRYKVAIVRQTRIKYIITLKNFKLEGNIEYFIFANVR